MKHKHHHGIGLDGFTALFLQFFEASGYEVYRNGRKINTFDDQKKYVRSVFALLISAVAAARRVSIKHLVEIEFIRSSRKSESPLLKLRPHSLVSRYFKANPHRVRWEGTLDERSVCTHAFGVFNDIADIVITQEDKDQVVTTNHNFFV
jgi:hypothetical protein